MELGSITACTCTQLCLAVCDPMDCSLPGSSVHGIFQVRILEWVVTSSSRGSSWPRDWTHISWISCIGRQILNHWATIITIDVSNVKNTDNKNSLKSWGTDKFWVLYIFSINYLIVSCKLQETLQVYLIFSND